MTEQVLKPHFKKKLSASGARLAPPDKEWLLENRKINPSTQCWEWTGSKTKYGYGRVRSHGKSYGIHALSYSFWVGENPLKLMICHKCDNRICFNPEHLFLGTAKENTQDAVKKGRLAKGENHGSNILTQNQVLEIILKRKPNASTAQYYGVSQSTVQAIRSGKIWSWLTGIKYQRKNDRIGC